MSTRLKRPSFWRQILFTATLLALQGYLGYSVLSGQFGIESQRTLEGEIGELEATSAALQAEIDAYRHRAALFNPQRLDPDIVTEKARALLSMAQPDDLVVMVDERGKPRSSSLRLLASDELTSLIDASSIQ